MRNVFAATSIMIIALLLSLICYAEQEDGVVIDESNFPDNDFRMEITYQCDENSDGYLSAIEMENVKNLTMPDTAIASLQGIEFFKNLQYLEICSSELTSLDCRSNTLLEELWCGECALNNLNVSGCSRLKILVCGGNELTELNVKNCRELEILYCEWNHLTTLDISNCSQLSYLDCSQNDLSSIDISCCPFIVEAYQKGSVYETNDTGEEYWDEDVHPFCTYQEGEVTDSEYDYDYAHEFCIDSGVTIDTESKPKPSVDEEYLTTVFTSSSGKIGNAQVSLKKGFDFTDVESSRFNLDLALTAVTLSAQIYANASGNHADEIMRQLGYDYVKLPRNGISSVFQPVACYGYSKIGEGKNLFTVVVRGTDVTDGATDIITNITDGFPTMFLVSEKVIRGEFMSFIETATHKSIELIKNEENYFFFTGHSLGGAVANILSIENDILDLAGFDKERIYTYTFEAPHTCINLLWMNPTQMSNAFNFKVEGDAVTNVPPHIGSTTYGKDLLCKVSLMSNNIF